MRDVGNITAYEMRDERAILLRTRERFCLVPSGLNQSSNKMSVQTGGTEIFTVGRWRREIWSRVYLTMTGKEARAKVGIATVNGLRRRCWTAGRSGVGPRRRPHLRRC